MSTVIRNHYCPKCRKTLASADISAQRHVACKTKVEWREQRVPTLDEGEKTDGT